MLAGHIQAQINHGARVRLRKGAIGLARLHKARGTARRGGDGVPVIACVQDTLTEKHTGT